MFSSIIFRISSVLITIHCLQIINLLNAVNISEVDHTSDLDMPTFAMFDIALENQSQVQTNLKNQLQKGKQPVPYKPNQQLQSIAEPNIEEISTDKMMDERLFNKKNNLDSLLKIFAKNYYQQRNQHMSPASKTNNPMATSININQDTLNDLRKQFVKMSSQSNSDFNSMPSQTTLAKNKELLQGLLSAMKQGSSYSRPSNAITNEEQTSNNNMQNQLVKLPSKTQMDPAALQTLFMLLNNQQQVKSPFPNISPSLSYPNPMEPSLYTKHNFSVPSTSSIVERAFFNSPEQQEEFFQLLNAPSKIYKPPLSITASETNSESSESTDDIPSSPQDLAFLYPSHEEVQEKSDEVESEAVKKLEQTVLSDIESITKKFEDTVSLDGTLSNEEHYYRANAFLVCCQLLGKPNKKLLNNYVDAYGSLKEQTNMIENCRSTLSGNDKKQCATSLQRLEKVRERIIRVFRKMTQNTSINPEDLIDSLDKSVKQSSDTKDIVSAYDSETDSTCEPALLLIWKAKKLIDCETNNREYILYLDDIRHKYDTFHNEISLPFQEKVINFRESLQNAWINIMADYEGKLATQTDDRLISEEQMNNEILQIMITSATYSEYVRHPLIRPYWERARVYDICCEPVETADMFNKFLDQFSDFKLHLSEEGLLKTCVDQLALKENYETIYYEECIDYYDNLGSDISSRLDFYVNNVKQNPNMMKDFQQAIKIGKDDIAIIQKMQEYIHKYCREEQVFKLMFNFNVNIKCEQLIRPLLRKENSKNYTFYNNVISNKFQNIVQRYWDRLIDIVINLKTGDRYKLSKYVYQLPEKSSGEKETSVITNKKLSAIVQKQNRPNRRGQLLSSLTDSSMVILPECFSIIFMLIIQIIFF